MNRHACQEIIEESLALRATLGAVCANHAVDKFQNRDYRKRDLLVRVETGDSFHHLVGGESLPLGADGF
jgi:hypothetical protein